MQFERLVEGHDQSRSLVVDTDVVRLILTRHGNVVSCVCELRQPTQEGLEALHRRGAVDSVFMISPKLAARDFGAWLDRLLVEDLGADPDSQVRILEPELIH
ncbi:MAG TPA: hypothetical protein VF157_13545 [Chloroflexota bacterium]